MSEVASRRCSGKTRAGVQCLNMTSSPSGVCGAKHLERSPSLPVDPSIKGAMSKLPTRGKRGVSPTPDAPEWFSMREYQREAVNDAMKIRARSDMDRAQVKAAPGAGKTFIGTELAREIDRDLVEQEGRHGVFVVLSPTIKLTEQLRNEFEKIGISSKSSSITVSSDSIDFEGGDSSDSTSKIIDFLSKDRDEPIFVFGVASQDSISKIAAAQKETGVVFDAAMMDEAHNYANDLWSSSKSGTSSPPRIYFNEQPNSIQADFRTFFSATPKSNYDQTSQVVASVVREVATGGVPRIKRPDNQIGSSFVKDQIIKGSESEDAGSTPSSFRIFQSDPDVFGLSVGSRSIGLSYVVDQGLLMKPELHAATVEVEAYSSGGKSAFYAGSDRVDMNGYLTDPNDVENSISKRNFAAIESIAMMTDDGGTRNAIVFCDLVKDANEVSDSARDVWATQGSNWLPGSDSMSDDDLSAIANDMSDSADYWRREGARRTLLSRHAVMTSVDGSMSSEEKDRAMSVWDDDGSDSPLHPCTCGGRNRGGWCACLRVVSNVSVLGEGISKNSIDTVIFNKGESGFDDHDVFQALGRASRIWRDSSGASRKRSSKFVVPEVIETVGYDSEGSPRKEKQNHRQFNKIMGSASRAWRDVAANDMLLYRDIEEGYSGSRINDVLDASEDLPINRRYGFEGETLPAAEELAQLPDGFESPEEVATFSTMWRDIEKSAAANYSQQKKRGEIGDARSWSQLSPDERHSRTLSYLSESKKKSGPGYALVEMLSGRQGHNVSRFIRNRNVVEEVVSKGIYISREAHRVQPEKRASSLRDFGSDSNDPMTSTLHWNASGFKTAKERKAIIDSMNRAIDSWT